MKIRIVIIFFILIQIVNTSAQEIKINGKIIDQNSNEPLCGAVVLYSGKPMSFSDEKGAFELLLPDSIMRDTTISISHLAYQRKNLLLSELKADTNIIFVKEQVYFLEEVRVLPVKNKDVLKQTRKHFKSTYPELPNWAEANYKQIITYRGKTRGYLECYGNMLLIGSKEKIPFIRPFIIPFQVRRSKEDPVVALIYNSAELLHISGSSVETLLEEYRFFEVFHPLSQRFTDYFDFHLDSICEINHVPCYLFSYKQKRKMGFGGNGLRNMRGQVWVDRSNYTLLKITFAFNLNRTFDQGTVEYKLIGNQIYPKHISMNSIYNSITTKSEPQKIFVKNDIVFENIDVIPRNYSRKYNYHIVCFLPGFKYDKAFWAHHPLKDNIFKDEILELMGTRNIDKEFEKGAAEKLFYDDNLINSNFKPISDKTIEIMKRDLNLK